MYVERKNLPIYSNLHALYEEYNCYLQFFEIGKANFCKWHFLLLFRIYNTHKHMQIKIVIIVYVL